MATNCVADVRKLATAALKSGHAQHGQQLKPSQWASVAGYNGSAASPLRQHMARSSGNGCGRQHRYPPMTAEVLLETLDLADKFASEKEQRRKDALARSISSKVRPSSVSGARAAKQQAKVNTRKAGEAKKAPRPTRKAKDATPTAA